MPPSGGNIDVIDWHSELRPCRVTLTNPDLGLCQSLPVGSEEKLEASRGSLQGQCFNTEDGQDDVGEDSTEPEDLRTGRINANLGTLQQSV